MGSGLWNGEAMISHLWNFIQLLLPSLTLVCGPTSLKTRYLLFTDTALVFVNNKCTNKDSKIMALVR